MAAAGVLLLLLLAAAFRPSPAHPCSTAFPGNRLYASCTDLPHLSSSLRWTYDAESSALSVAFAASAPESGWAAWGINPAPGGGMVGAQSLIAYRRSNGSFAVSTFNVSGYGPVRPSPIRYKVGGMAADRVGGMTRLFATVELPAGVSAVSQVWQVGDSVTDGIPNRHGFAAENLEAKGTLDLVSGRSTAVSGSRIDKKNTHGVLNAVSWGILLPMGAITARYLKTLKSGDPAWFYIHVSCQVIGYAVGTAGWGTGLYLGSLSKGVQYTTHRNIGITLFTLGTIQLFALFFRPNKDHKYRLYWNVYHHSVGYTVIVLGIVNVFKGLQILSPDEKWKHAYIAVICFLGGVAVLLEAVTWAVVIRRKKKKTVGLYNGAHVGNGQGVQEAFVI